MTSIIDVLDMIREEDIRFIDLKFVDLLGTWQHFSIPSSQLNEDVFEDGLGFDGSSIRGWKSIHNSDMQIMLDPSTAVIDPFYANATLSIICDVIDPITKEVYDRDPRQIAKRAETFLKSTGIADTVYFGPEPEFFLFDDVRFDSNDKSSFYAIDSDEAGWNSGRDDGPNLGYKNKNKGGYFPVPPNDSLAGVRHEMVLKMESVGLVVEREHHEVGGAGQCEISYRYNSLTKCADQTMWMKYIVKNVARDYDLAATFMPKPLAADNGSGMHCHQSLWKDGQSLFAGDEYAGFSELGLYYIGGLLKHAAALSAFTNPSMNSYRRLVPGFEAPTNLAYSARNRSAAIRIPVGAPHPNARRLECRFPDAMANPYLAFSAMMMAGLDGIENKIHPGEPLDKNIYGLSPEELKNVPQMPESLDDALNALEENHSFLLKGDVFSRDFIETWIKYKRENEIRLRQLQPTPLDYALYFDA